jgi:hypothetical protein
MNALGKPIESGGLIEFGPPLADRASLESVPGAGTSNFTCLPKPQVAHGPR